jgi:hypothetical protein
VESNLLSADEVLARGHAPRDSERDGGLAGAGGREGELTVASLAGRGLLEDLEPGLALAGVDRVGLGGLGHVDVDGAWVVHGLSSTDGHRRAGGDSSSLGLARGRVVVELVAANGLVLDVGDGAVAAMESVDDQQRLHLILTSSGWQSCERIASLRH